MNKKKVNDFTSNSSIQNRKINYLYAMVNRKVDVFQNCTYVYKIKVTYFFNSMFLLIISNEISEDLDDIR